MNEGPLPWMPGDTPANAFRLHAPATVRNRDAICAVLGDVLPARGKVLEIASGSGEHIVHFARAFPKLSFQPSDPDPLALASIAAHAADAALPNILPPLPLDASEPGWSITRADAMLCINMIHISPWTATLGLLEGAARLLESGAPLYLYGPYFREDVAAAPSNVAFDASLRARDPAWGLRDLSVVVCEATVRGFSIERVVEMPANNLSVILRRR